jgi:DNA-binding cell septation regulator SpoVG
MDYNESGRGQETAEAMPLKLDVSVKPVPPKNGLVAVATVKFNGCFAVNGVKIVTGSKGLFVDMPSIPDGRGNYHSVCHPTTAYFRKALTKAVLDGYNEAIEKMWDMLDAAENLRSSNAFPERTPAAANQPKDAEK